MPRLVDENGRRHVVEKPKAVPIALINLSDLSEIEAVATAIWLGSILSGSVPGDGEVAEALAAWGMEPDSANVAAVERFLKREALNPVLKIPGSGGGARVCGNDRRSNGDRAMGG